MFCTRSTRSAFCTALRSGDLLRSRVTFSRRLRRSFSVERPRETSVSTVFDQSFSNELKRVRTSWRRFSKRLRRISVASIAFWKVGLLDERLDERVELDLRDVF